MDVHQQMWSFFWGVAALFLPLAVLFLLKKSSRISDHTTSSRSESSAGERLTAPSSSNSPLPMEYEVFLSFRGPDVRTGFADFLYKFLDNSKIRTFLDDEELRKGEKIAPSLVEAVKESKIYIPILSPNYASSKWCLQELALMVKCWKQGNGHIILPIFYMMDPRDVRHQKGSYEKALRQLSKKFDSETIEEWKEALRETGEMKGWHVLESDRQGVVIDEVFAKVWSHLRAGYMLVTDRLIGIGSHLEKMKELLQLESEGLKVIGIHGMGGIGKTTIAKALYNEVHGQFDRCCFVEGVRETLSKTNGIVSLQRKIISSILRSDYEVEDANEGINIIKNRICRHKVIIILDDADDRFKFDKILGKLEDFCLGSIFIITTRDRRIMEFFQSYELYEPEEMSEDHSLELFSRNAFGMDHPPEQEVALSMEFVNAATRLPLSLKVIGSLLFRRDNSFWKATLKQLKDVLPLEVQETLRISYNALSHEEQQIFLDIACLFIGENKAQPFYMWDSCGYHPEIVITTLIQRSLIRINQTNDGEEFWMHDHIIDLGKTIIREEDLECSWKRSRIWRNEDALDMLTHEKGTDRLKALRVDIEDETFKLTDRQFRKLSGLRYLEVDYGECEGNFELILPNIRWLKMLGCCFSPIYCDMKKLVNFNLHGDFMEGSVIRDDWRGWEKLKMAHNLKSISLYECIHLEKVPDFSQCGNLELIDIKYCKEMSGELHIGNMKNLKVLKIERTEIEELTGDIGMLQNLQEITLIDLNLRKLPDGINRLSSLVDLYISDWASRQFTPTALPVSLKRLCLPSPCIPNLMNLENLENLELDGYEHQFPGDIWKLSKLKSLKLSRFRCESLLTEVGDGMDAHAPCGLPSSLFSIDIRSSMGLERLPNLENLGNLTSLALQEINVCEIHGLAKLRMLEAVDICSAPSLIHLDGLEHQTFLKTFILNMCDKLERLPNMWNLNKLERLEISNCGHLTEFCVSSKVWEPEYLGSKLNLSNQESGSTQEIEEIGKYTLSSLEQFTEAKGLVALEYLSIMTCTSIRTLSFLHDLQNLSTLIIRWCDQLTEVVGLEKLETLQELGIYGCPSIKKLPDISHFKHLQKLEICAGTQLTEIAGIENLKELTELKIDKRLKIPQLESQVQITCYSSGDEW